MKLLSPNECRVPKFRFRSKSAHLIYYINFFILIIIITVISSSEIRLLVMNALMQQLMTTATDMRHAEKNNEYRERTRTHKHISPQTGEN